MGAQPKNAAPAGPQLKPSIWGQTHIHPSDPIREGEWDLAPRPPFTRLLPARTEPLRKLDLPPLECTTSGDLPSSNDLLRTSGTQPRRTGTRGRCAARA